MLHQIHKHTSGEQKCPREESSKGVAKKPIDSVGNEDIEELELVNNNKSVLIARVLVLYLSDVDKLTTHQNNIRTRLDLEKEKMIIRNNRKQQDWNVDRTGGKTSGRTKSIPRFST